MIILILNLFFAIDIMNMAREDGAIYYGRKKTADE